MVKCPECELKYIPDIPDNLEYHNRYHDEMVNGVSAVVTGDEQIVWRKEEKFISVINFLSTPSQKKLAEQVGIITNRDTKYDFQPYSADEKIDERDVHILLYHQKGRVIGFLLIEKRTHIWNCTWQQYEQRKPTEVTNIPYLWSVGLVWVNRQHRRGGIAKRLIKEAAQFFDVEVKGLGWYAPPITESGKAMLRGLLPEGYYITK